MHRTISVMVAGLILLACGGQPIAAEEPVSVMLELSREFFYEGTPLQLRISVRNGGTQAVDNPVKSPLFEAFKVRTESGELKPTGKVTAEQPDRPARLAPQSFYGGVLDVTEIYPELREVGTYSLHWSADGMLSNLLTVKVIPQYDPAKGYGAVVTTDQGPILIDLYREQSPLAVKAFVDMANAGYYDGLLFHEVVKDSHIAGGDPELAGIARNPFRFPAEQSSLPLVAGTVIFRPKGASPPANGSEFIILLKPQPDWAGQVTVLGQVVKGLDVVQAISSQPSSGRNSRPFFKPLKPVTIRTVSIMEKKAPS
jgi:peptidyl-prolyl cis-trans isomerase A (cyclophilin A)